MKTNNYINKCAWFLVFFLGLSFSFCRAQTFWTEDFESGSGNWTLNTTDLSSTNTGFNKWTVNNTFASGTINVPFSLFTCNDLGCLGVPSPAVPNQPTQVTNNPTSNYLHIVYDYGVYGCGPGSDNAHYLVTDPSGICVRLPENYFVEMNTDISTIGMTNVNIGFWWTGITSSAAYGEFYYSIDGGNSWVLGMSNLYNESGWKKDSLSNPSFDNQPTLRFAFRFVNGDAGGAGLDHAFSIDQIEASIPATGSPPVADFNVTDTVICEGDCINFFDTSTNSPTSWTWNFPGSVAGSSTDQNPTNICYDSTGTYDVDLIATNTSGSDNIIKTNHITVFPTVNFDTEYDTSMCEGDSVDLHINNLIGGLRIDSIDMYFYSQFTYTTPSTVAGGIYYFTVEAFYWGSTGEKRDAAYKYENNNQPITPIPSSMWKIDGNGPGKPCPTDYNPNHLYYFYFTGTGSGVTLTFDDTDYNDNGGKLIFRMYYVDSNPNSILWSNGDTEPCINVAPSVTTTYTATVTNAGGCSGSNTATVTVTTPPAIDAGPDTSICVGTVFSLANATIGAGGIVTTWNSTGDGNFDNPTLLNPNYTLGSADIANGSVQLTIEGLDSSGLCTPAYDTMVLSIGLSPTIDSVVTVDASFCNMPDGSAVAFVSGGNAPYTYNWSSGQTSSDAVGLAGGSYSVTVSGTDGCSSTTSGIVINQPGTIPPPSLNNDTIYCQGDPMADLNATGSSGTISWYSDPVLTNLLGTGNTLSPSNTLGTTTYYATETQGGCISTADSVTVTINPIVSNSQSLSICSADSVFAGGAFQNTSGTYFDTLTAANGCDSVLTTNLTVNSFSTGSQTISICSEDSVLVAGTFQNTSGTYYDTLTAVNGCDSVLTTNLTVDVLITGSQSLNICSDDSVFAGGAFQNTSGTYFDTLTAVNGCDSVLTTNLTVNSSSAGSQSISICSDDSVLVGGGYQNTSGTYFDTLTAANGCDSILTTNLTVNQATSTPTVNADAIYCQGDTIVDITATGTGGTINWYSPLSTQVGSGSTFTPNNTLGTTIYYATETNGNCESNPDSAIITISISPSPPTLSTTVSYCNQDPMIDLTATANSGGTITWYLDAGLTNSIGTGSGLTPIDSLGTIIYFATETVGTCTSAADTVTVTIYQVSPPPSVSIDTNLCLENTSHELSATPLWGGTITWHEDIALLIEIDTGNTLIPSFELGTNTYYVTETALCCCKSQPTMVTVTVEDCDTIPDNVYMPNVFYLPGTNADNNKLHVHGSGIETLNLVIYDRWGEIVYETNDVSSKTREDGLCCAYGSGWNGTYLNSGKELNTASFAYILTGTFENGDQFSEKGNITLIK